MDSPLVQVRSQLAIDSDSGSDTTITLRNEPFPDFDAELCVPNPNRYEAEWAHAFTKAVQDDIRTRSVDPFIIPHNAGEPFTRSNILLEDIKDLLAEPHMRETTRQQFLVMINHTLHLHQVIFHHSDQFLDTTETAEAKILAEHILSYMGWMDAKLLDQVSAAEQVAVVLDQVCKEKTEIYERYVRMTTVVSAHLKKPRPLERRLLSLFLEFYEAWVHNDFLRQRNHQILAEDIPVTGRIDLSRRIIAIWDLLTRCIENYSLYTWGTRTIRNKYFAPAMELLSDAPDIWQRCWDKRSAFDRHPTILGPIQQSPRSQAVQSPLEFDITEDQQSTSSQSTPVAKLEIVEAWNTNLSGLATDQRY